MNAVTAKTSSAVKILDAAARRAAFFALNHDGVLHLSRQALAAAAGVSLRTLGRQLPKLLEEGSLVETDEGIVEASPNDTELLAEFIKSIPEATTEEAEAGEEIELMRLDVGFPQVVEVVEPISSEAAGQLADELTAEWDERAAAPTPEDVRASEEALFDAQEDAEMARYTDARASRNIAPSADEMLGAMTNHRKVELGADAVTVMTEPGKREKVPASAVTEPVLDDRSASVPRTRERAILVLIASDEPMALTDIVDAICTADGCSPTTVKTTTYLVRRLGWLSRDGAKGDFSVTDAGREAIDREKAAHKGRTATKTNKARVAAALAYVASIPNQSSDIVEALNLILAG